MSKEKILDSMRAASGSQDLETLEHALGQGIGFLEAFDEEKTVRRCDARDMVRMAASGGTYPQHWDDKCELHVERT